MKTSPQEKEAVKLLIKSGISNELIDEYVYWRKKGRNEWAGLQIVDSKLKRQATDKEAKLLQQVYSMRYRNELLGELLTSDDIPDRLGMWEPVKKKKERDKLYQQRLKQNPELKNNIKKIGEQSMKTTVTFKSDNASAISRQWHLMFTIDDKSWNSWDISNIKSDNSSYMFTLTSYQKDQRLNQKDLESYLVAGVDMSITKGRNESKDNEDSIASLLELDNLTPEQIADVLLADEDNFTEAKMSIGLQVTDVDNALKDLKKAGISAKPHAKLDDEVTLSFDSKDKGKVVKTLNKMGWDNDDIDDLYPELLESFTEAEVPDDEDSESDTIDDVQSMLTKMLPKTKGLKLGADKEKELKATLKKAMSMMGESTLTEVTAKLKGTSALLKVNKLSSAEYSKIKKHSAFNKDDWKWDPEEELYIKVKKTNESILDELTQLGQEMGDYDLTEKASMKVIQSGTKARIEKLKNGLSIFARDTETSDAVVLDITGKNYTEFLNFIGSKIESLEEAANYKDSLGEVYLQLKNVVEQMKKQKAKPEDIKKVEMLLKKFNDELSSVSLGEAVDYPQFQKEGANKFSVISLDGKVLGKNLPLTKAVELAQKHKASLVRDEGVTDFLKALKKEAVDYPQFQFAIAIPREDYATAAKVLNDSNIDLKTRFASGGMAILGFDYHNETGRGNPNVTEEEIISILSNVGIAASVIDGSEFNHEPLTMEIDD